MSNMRSYETARGMFSFLAFVGWSAVVIGVLAAISGAQMKTGFGGSVGFVGALPGIIIAVVGLLNIAIVQAARATVDTAEYTQQMLKIARDQLDVSKQSLKQGYQAEPTYSTRTEKGVLAQSKGYAEHKAAKDSEPNDNAPKDVEYKGKLIVSFGSAYHYQGIPFEYLDQAKKYIDQLAIQEPSKLSLPSKDN